MSVTWLSRAWDTEVGSPTRKSVLIALADRCGEEGICWPSHGDLQRRSELGRTAVRNALDELEVDGFIESWGRERPDGSKTSKGYRLLIDEITQGDGRETAMGGRQKARGGSPRGQRTEPSSEPSTDLVPNGTATTSGRRAKRSFGQPAGEDESPAHGAGPVARREKPAAPAVRPPRNEGRTPALPERKDYSQLTPAAEAADTPHRCALRFKQLSIKNKKIDPANLMEFTATLKRWYADGLELEVLRTMVDTFAARPESYMTGRQDIPWRAFINAREKLQADATKVDEAKNPTRKFGSAYARAAAR